MKEKLVDVGELARELENFATERDWAQFHGPKNLALALVGEVGELCEVFQWLNEEEARAVASDPERGPAVREELADVLFYLVRLAQVLGVDLDEAARAKLLMNAAKYPVPKAKGRHAKYTKL